MTHLHIPDGILPVWLWLSGFIFVIIYLICLGFYLKNKPFQKKLALVGVFAALMMVAMSIEIVPFPYHVKLCSLTGIILGPVFSVLTIFVVNVILALIGHGGITIVGLNTVILSLEALLAYIIFRTLHKKFKKVFITAFISTVLALLVATCANLTVVYLGTGNINLLLHKHEHHHNETVVEHQHNNHDHHSVDEYTEHKDHHMAHNDHSVDTIEKEADKQGNFDIKRFIILVFGLSLIGWVLEGSITGFIVSYLYKIKPDLLE